MPNYIEQEAFTKSLFSLLEEAFEKHHGIFLDPETSLFQTLSGINAEQASLPVGGRCATLAAQVAHVIFYIEVLERYIFEDDRSRADWGRVWREVTRVSPAEWQNLQDQLKSVYQRVMEKLRLVQPWNEDTLGGALAILAHTAYHLGEIRQALCLLSPS